MQKGICTTPLGSLRLLGQRVAFSTSQACQTNSLGLARLFRPFFSTTPLQSSCALFSGTWIFNKAIPNMNQANSDHPALELTLFEQIVSDASGNVWRGCVQEWQGERQKLLIKMQSANLQDPAQFEVMSKLDETLSAAEWVLGVLASR